MAEPTVDDLPAEADALQAVELRLDNIGDGDVREPHRHAYHELIWVQDGHGRHLIDGEPVDFGPRTLTLIAKGQVHQFKEADGVSGVVVRFDDEWLTGARRWLFSGGSCTAMSVPPDEAPRFGPEIFQAQSPDMAQASNTPDSRRLARLHRAAKCHRVT